MLADPSKIQTISATTGRLQVGEVVGVNGPEKGEFVGGASIGAKLGDIDGLEVLGDIDGDEEVGVLTGDALGRPVGDRVTQFWFTNACRTKKCWLYDEATFSLLGTLRQVSVLLIMKFAELATAGMLDPE